MIFINNRLRSIISLSQRLRMAIASIAMWRHSCNNFPWHTLVSEPVISIVVNGEARTFNPPLNCAELIDRLELAGKRVALERNGEIVPRSRFPEQMLADGDRLEIVVAVGGG